MLRLNKKAVVSDDFIPWLVMIIIAVFAIFSFAMYQANEVKAQFSQLELYKNKIENEKALNSLLQSQSPITFADKSQLSVADSLSVLYSLNSQSSLDNKAIYLNMLDGYIKNSAQKMGEKALRFIVYISRDGQEIYWLGISYGDPKISYQEEAMAYLPTLEKGVYLVVKLSTAAQ